MSTDRIGADARADSRTYSNGESRSSGEDWLRQIGRLMLNSSRDWVAILSPDGGVRFMNSPARTGVEWTNLVESGQPDWVGLWHPAYQHAAALALKQAASGGTGHLVAPIEPRDGNLRWWDVQISRLEDWQSRPKRLLAISRDVTVHKETEERLAAALAQKDLLFRELSHRILNGLQLIASILRLQRRQVADDVARSVLRSAEQRVQAMAAINRRLHVAGGAGIVRMDAYITRLCDAIAKAHIQRGTSDLRCNVESGVELTSDRAIVVGLLTAELVINALKHARRPDDRSIVEVTISTEGAAYVLAVTDNGPGLTDDFDPARSKGLGMTIARSQAKQLASALEYQRLCSGTRFLVRFPK